MHACMYVCMLVPPLGAYKSQLGGHIFYRCWFIWSTSTVIIRLYFYVYIHLVNYIIYIIASVFAGQMHSTTKFAMTVLSKCLFVCVCLRILRLPILEP